MSTMLADSPEVLEAYDAYKKFTSNPAIREQIMTMEREEKQIRLRLAGARREGIAEGKMEGKVEGKVETARLMIQNGYSTAEIIKLTGLTSLEIERLEGRD